MDTITIYLLSMFSTPYYNNKNLEKEKIEKEKKE
jgi:hypothetical protein